VAHVLAARELHRQASERGAVPELVVLAVGSGATLAGWLLGSVAFDLPWRVVGYTVSRPAEEARARVSALADEAAALLGVDPGSAVDERIEVRAGVIGDGYGMPTAAGRAATELVARREGILLDPTYTAKAFGGYAADVAAGRYAGVDRAVFLHTGGEPALFVGAR
jgi:1-aminocyclopropane-1-carboxylate deaminase/D-cysteine desulfhydrase-like pyridoxal-dependent ACC family enzyme